MCRNDADIDSQKMRTVLLRMWPRFTYTIALCLVFTCVNGYTHTHTHRGHIMQWYSCFKQTYIQWSHITLRLFIDMPSLVHIVRRELMRKRVNPYEMHSFNSQTFIHILTKMLYETPDYCNKCLVTLKEWSREEQSDLNGRKEKKRGTRIQSFGDKPIRPWSCVECYACYS